MLPSNALSSDPKFKRNIFHQRILLLTTKKKTITRVTKLEVKVNFSVFHVCLGWARIIGILFNPTHKSGLKCRVNIFLRVYSIKSWCANYKIKSKWNYESYTYDKVFEFKTVPSFNHNQTSYNAKLRIKLLCSFRQITRVKQ